MKKHNLKIILIVSFVLITILVAAGVWYKNSQYEYVPLRRSDITEAIYGLGKVKAFRKFEVKSSVVNIIEKLYVREGELVKNGDPLVKFEDGATFRAPFTGVISNVQFNESEYVVPNTPTIILKDLDKNYIEVSLEQEGALRVKKGMKAKVLFESMRGETYEGIVSALFASNDDFLAKIHVENLPEAVLHGMTADVSIIVAQRKNVLLVPVSSLDHQKVIVRRNGKKIKINVKIGSIDGSWAEVISGDFMPDDEVLIKKADTSYIFGNCIWHHDLCGDCRNSTWLS